MNIIKASRVVTQSSKALSATQRLVAVASIALLLLLALLSTTEQRASEAQFDAKLQSAAAAVDTGLSNVQKFFPASFR